MPDLTPVVIAVSTVLEFFFFFFFSLRPGYSVIMRLAWEPALVVTLFNSFTDLLNISALSFEAKF